MQSCCSPSASASTAAPRVRSLQLLLPECVRFNCCSASASASTCCSRVRPLQLAAPRVHPLQLLHPDCVRSSCCSPLASASSVAPRLRMLRLLLPDCVRLLFWKIPAHAHAMTEFEFKYEGRASLAESSPASRTSHFRHAYTQQLNS